MLIKCQERASSFPTVFLGKAIQLELDRGVRTFTTIAWNTNSRLKEMHADKHRGGGTGVWVEERGDLN